MFNKEVSLEPNYKTAYFYISDMIRIKLECLDIIYCTLEKSTNGILWFEKYHTQLRCSKEKYYVESVYYSKHPNLKDALNQIYNDFLYAQKCNSKAKIEQKTTKEIIAEDIKSICVFDGEN